RSPCHTVTPPPPPPYPPSLHDALPISRPAGRRAERPRAARLRHGSRRLPDDARPQTDAHPRGDAGLFRHTGDVGQLPPSEALLRSEERTSDLQSLRQLVCRLLLEKKKT